jgi:predicted PurR-regulated permease PerM
MQTADTRVVTMVSPQDARGFAYSKILLAILLILSIFALDFAREFLLPVTMAFFLALTFRPLIRKASKKGIPAWLSASIFMLTLIIVGSVLIYALSAPISAFIADAPGYTQAFLGRLHIVGNWLKPITDFAGQLSMSGRTAVADSQTINQTPGILTNASPSIINYVFQSAGYSIDVVATIVLTAVTAAFMMASGDLFYEKLIRVLPTLSDKKRALRIVYDVEDEISAYIVTVTLINLGLGICVGAAFFALGMPMAFLWGILVFLFNFVPYVGAVFGVALAGFIAVATFDSFGYALLVPVAYAVLNGIENQFVTPVFLGRRLQLNSVAILIFLTFWTWEWGIAGTMLAVPILMTVKVLCSHIQGMAGLGEFLSGPHQEPEETPAETALP